MILHNQMMIAFYLYITIMCNGSILPLSTHASSNIQYKVQSPVFENIAPPDLFRPIHHPFPPQYTPTMNNTHLGDGATKGNTKSMVVPTNSWLSNLFYPSTNNMAPTNTDPYTIRILDSSMGVEHLGISVVQKQEKILGTYATMMNHHTGQQTEEPGYMMNQVVVDMRLSCQEWTAAHHDHLTVQVLSWDHFGATVKLLDGQANAKNQWIETPLARGMAYVTARYQALTPLFFTQHVILRVECENKYIIQNTTTMTMTTRYQGDKFKIILNDPLETTFIIYALDGTLSLTCSDPSTLIASAPYTGTIRVAKLPNGMDMSILDRHRHSWTTGGIVDYTKNSYTINWKVQGKGQPLLYAYPHHIQTISNVERTTLRLESATKGTMYGVLGTRWILHEQQQSTTATTNRGGSSLISWLPQQARPESSTRNDILRNLAHEIETSDYNADTNKNDNYFSGKALQKYAMLALLLNRPQETSLYNPELAQLALDKLKFAFAVFLENRQRDPFVYDRVYKGIVAQSGLPVSMGGTGDIHAAFGHSYYNDHHYHQGYLVVTAAVIHYLDPSWRTNEIKIWTNSLIRDVNSPGHDDDDDDYFAPYRHWDWFAGHTWAGGIKINGAMDGRDQESVPESINFYWGMKLWGLATHRPSLVQLANLQLDIMKRTTYEYFWMLNSNKNRHAGLVLNKVVGILFEQKLDYTTYFGRKPEYIHGIQQLPMTAMLAEVFRTPQFVQEEWDQRLAAIISNVKSAWAGVLYLNYAMINPSDAYPALKKVKLDDGQSRSYSLYLAATRPGFRRRSLSRVVSGISLSAISPSEDTTIKPSLPRLIDISNNQHDDRYNGY